MKDPTNLKLEAISIHRPKFRKGYCRKRQTRNLQEGLFKWSVYKIIKKKK